MQTSGRCYGNYSTGSVSEGGIYKRTTPDLDECEKTIAAALLIEFADVFVSSPDDLGKTSIVQHSINTGDSQLIRQNARQLPLCQQAVAERKNQMMLQIGVVELSSSPWASPIALVRKKDGSTRFCVDYPQLNATTVKDS